MHPDLSEHLHTSECNILIDKLKECHQTKKFGKFLGFCNEIDTELSKCLKQERKDNQHNNRKKALEKQAKVRDLLQKS